jgi:hypothetical protein
MIHPAEISHFAGLSGESIEPKSNLELEQNEGIPKIKTL